MKENSCFELVYDSKKTMILTIQASKMDFNLIKCFKYVNARLVDRANNCSTCISYILHCTHDNAAALASKLEVGSSTKIMEGLATSSTAIVSRLRCSVDRPL